ncbi:hypothetical protein J1G43_12880 [Cellulomonas sp. zg-ZUI22]|uniref:hypothetical protein n=1 Tax=Cellulomonas sp. zg-ZUI22 TaxID=2816955 RepID=UPI001A9473B4|nr:hypothetical protein [Cellulomonas sp. zg-ZUI22]MBO0900858.1 hypothetical protein [Cellulomonas sp. zg-ZUI22]
MSGLGDALEADYREHPEAGVTFDPAPEPPHVEPTATGGLQYALGVRLRDAADGQERSTS